MSPHPEISRRARVCTFATAFATALVLGACGHGRRERPARSGAAVSTGSTGSAAGEVGPAAFDTSLVPPRSPDSTGRFGAPGYGFGQGGRYVAPGPPPPPPPPPPAR